MPPGTSKKLSFTLHTTHTYPTHTHIHTYSQISLLHIHANPSRSFARQFYSFIHHHLSPLPSSLPSPRQLDEILSDLPPQIIEGMLPSLLTFLSSSSSSFILSTLIPLILAPPSPPSPPSSRDRHYTCCCNIAYSSQSLTHSLTVHVTRF